MAKTGTSVYTEHHHWVMNTLPNGIGAGEENRTLVFSLATNGSAIKLRPRGISTNWLRVRGVEPRFECL